MARSRLSRPPNHNAAPATHSENACRSAHRAAAETSTAAALACVGRGPARSQGSSSVEKHDEATFVRNLIDLAAKLGSLERERKSWRRAPCLAMDLTRLANLGEFIGGVAVLVTLIYLTLRTVAVFFYAERL